MYKIINDDNIIYLDKKDELRDFIANKNVFAKIDDALDRCLWVEYANYKICKMHKREEISCKRDDCFFNVEFNCQALRHAIKKKCVFFKLPEEVENKLIKIS